jgi:DNA-binding transcriptional ArsR family regulator
MRRLSVGTRAHLDPPRANPNTVPLISHHLKLLREAGLIDTEKQGIWAYYWAMDEGRKTLAAVKTLI